jgi:probable HAF family extracellular repeat protein
MWTKILAASLFVCLIPTLALSQAAYTITDLGPLSPTAINSWAQVVGNYNNQAYIWAFGRMRPLGILTGGTFSTASAINDLGEVAGTADGVGTVISRTPGVSNQNCIDLTQPFIWTEGNGMQGLGAVTFSGINPYWCAIAFDGSGINNFGQFVGDVPTTFDLYAYGLLWTKANGMTLFGDSWGPTFVLAISNTGEIVGQDSTYSTQLIGHATAWKNGVETDLGTLGGDVDDYSSSAKGVNDLGQVVGWSTTSTVSCCSSSPVHAVLWTLKGVMQDLGTLPGDTSSAAARISFFGQVIGSSGNTLWSGGGLPLSGVGRPFIWTQQRGMRDLNTLIPANSQWVLNTATDINVWGQIVGTGTHNGQTHGFLLTPRNPFSLF